MHDSVVDHRIYLRVCCAGELLPITLPIINERLREGGLQCTLTLLAQG